MVTGRSVFSFLPGGVPDVEMEKADPGLAFARSVNLLEPAFRRFASSQLLWLCVRPMWRTFISMTGASARPESTGWLAEEEPGGCCGWAHKVAALATLCVPSQLPLHLLLNV